MDRVFSSRLDGFFAKLGRAKQQTDALQADHTAFIANAYRSGAQSTFNEGEYLMRIVEMDIPPLHEWAVRTGEILHNLHSALDHLAFQLAGDEAGEHTAFPITDSPEAWKAALTPTGKRPARVAGMPVEAVNAIKGLQPCHGGDRVRLSMLRDLSNWDKHRLLHLGRLLTEITELSVVKNPEADVRVLDFTPGPFVDGAVVARLLIQSRSDIPPEVYMNAGLSVRIVFDEGTPAEQRPVTRVLSEIAGFIETDVFIGLEEFFPFQPEFPAPDPDEEPF